MFNLFDATQKSDAETAISMKHHGQCHERQMWWKGRWHLWKVSVIFYIYFHC